MIKIRTFASNFDPLHTSFGVGEYAIAVQINNSIQKVSKMSISLVDPYFWRSRVGGSSNLGKISSKLVSKYIFTRFSLINISFIGSRVGVHQGSRFHAFRIRKEMVGAHFSDFIRTYKLSPKIGSKKKNGYFSGRSKKKVSSIRKNRV